MSNPMIAWHKFFAVAKFPLTFSDRDYSSLQISPSYPQGGDAPPTYFLTPEGSSLFSFIALDANDYTKGYKISCGGYYIAGIGTYHGPMVTDCLSATTDPNQALVWIPEFTDLLTFSIKSLNGQELMTRPWDWLTNNNYGRKAILPIAPGDPAWSGNILQQVFKMPLWPIRIIKMAYVSSESDFYLQSGNNVLYADNNQLALGAVSDNSAIVSFSTPDPSLAHAGYVICVGGKYVQMVNADQSINLIDDITQATRICVISNADGSFSFWQCESDYILSLKGNLPVFTLCDNPQAIPPSWIVIEPTPDLDRLNHLNLLTVPATSITLNDTVYLKKIVEGLNLRARAKKGTTWNYSFNNTLPSDWLIATPENAFGNYIDFEMPIVQQGANDFNLEPCDGSPPDPKHPCIELASSVKASGVAPLNLHAGHSRTIYEEMYKVIITGNSFIDIMSLLRKDETPSGEFLAAIRNAISYLSLKPQARNITIRLLFGEPLGWVGDSGWIPGTGPYRAAPDVLRDLVRDVPSFTNSNMKVYVAYTSSVPSITWNHSKMIAVDGTTALVGGHNMWSATYLRDNPVLDVSMKLSGLAAADAQYFADNLWFLQVTSATSDYWVDDAASFIAPTTFASGQAAVPAARLFSQSFSEPQGNPGRNSGTGIPVLSVGREEGTIAGIAASDTAFISLMDAATENVYISAQALSHTPISARVWLVNFLNALANALKRGVNITIFMSDPSNGSYKGDPPLDVLDQIQSRITGKSQTEIAALMRQLAVRSFPPASFWGLSNQPGISNHAKVIMVDKKVFSIGSQNFYPSEPATMSEFSYIVEDSTTAQYLYDNYFAKMENWALASPAISGSVGDLSTYTITIISMLCYSVSGGGFGSNSPDEIYLNVNGQKAWPSDAKYEYIHALESATFTNLVLGPITLFDNEIILELWESDWFGDDHLGDYKFHPDTFINCRPLSGTYDNKKLADLSPGITYETQGIMYEEARYTIRFSFIKSTPS